MKKNMIITFAIDIAFLNTNVMEHTRGNYNIHSFFNLCIHILTTSESVFFHQMNVQPFLARFGANLVEFNSTI